MAAKALAATKARRADQRSTKAEVHAARVAGGAARARHRASCLTNEFRHSTGPQLRCLALRAASSVAPTVRPAAQRGSARSSTRRRGWCRRRPVPRSGCPLAMTGLGARGHAPASRQTLAAARSRGPPQVARWSPSSSWRAPHRHRAATRGSLGRRLGLAGEHQGWLRPVRRGTARSQSKEGGGGGGAGLCCRAWQRALQQMPGHGAGSHGSRRPKTTSTLLGMVKSASQTKADMG